MLILKGTWASNVFNQSHPCSDLNPKLFPILFPYVVLSRLADQLFLRRGTAIFSPGVGLGLSPVREGDYNSTCSILDASDLSFDNTQGSVLGGHDDSKLRSAHGDCRLVAKFYLDKCLVQVRADVQAEVVRCRLRPGRGPPGEEEPGEPGAQEVTGGHGCQEVGVEWRGEILTVAIGLIWKHTGLTGYFGLHNISLNCTLYTLYFRSPGPPV